MSDHDFQRGLIVPPGVPGSRGSASDHVTVSAPALRYRVEGNSNGLTVVLAHALGTDLTMWDALAADLAPDYRVVRYDQRGHGGSAAPPGPYSMAELVDDAARLVREVSGAPVVWVGLSMGGMVGQGLAASHPQLLRGLVIANSTSYYPPEAQAMWRQRIARVEAEGLAGIIDMVMERYFTAEFRHNFPDEAARIRAIVAATDRTGYLGCCTAIAALDLRAVLPRIACPTLVLAGRADQGTPVVMAEQTAAAIAGARLHVIAEASHLSAVEQPEAFAGQIRAFLHSLP